MVLNMDISAFIVNRATCVFQKPKSSTTALPNTSDILIGKIINNKQAIQNYLFCDLYAQLSKLSPIILNYSHEHLVPPTLADGEEMRTRTFRKLITIRIHC